ncbi:MAG TPA: hypothetical protein DD435_06375 [Cyanobacteria bacterium UBA8530]|nr:hypothetical protein [Cyanobacteria bacterium UBA8530]
MDNLIVWDDHSIWGTDLFFAIDQEVPGLESERISGTFFAKVFEGPYKEIPRWIETMKNILAQKQKTLKGLLFYYTTCPKCAKKQGKNPVVLLARI